MEPAQAQWTISQARLVHKTFWLHLKLSLLQVLDESGIRQFRLFGEDAPGWFVWGLALLGLAGFVATAQLLVPLLEKQYIPQYLGQFAGSGGSQGQPSPMRRSDTNDLSGLGPTEDRESVPRPNKSGTDDSASLPVRHAESGPGTMPSGSITVLFPGATSSESLAPQHSPPSSEALADSLGPIPDLLVDLRLPTPLPETSASEENLDGSVSTDSGHDRGIESDAEISQPTDGNGREPSSATVIPDHTAQVSGEGAEKATAVAALPDQVDSRSSDCAPMFLVTFSRGGVKPVEHDLSSKVKQLADWLHRHPAAQVYLEGHTDGVGDEEFNLVLSHRRARAVAELLVQAGVPTTQLSTRAYGESMLADSRSRSGRNRRVSMRVTDGNECPPKAEDHEG